MKPSLATQVRNLGLHERLVRAIEEIQQLLRVGAGVLPGDKADQWVRRRDLIEWGFATQPGGGMPPAPAWPDVPPGPAPSDPLPPDLTPPPPPTGVFTIGGYTSIFVVWDPIVDRRIGYFEVWRASVDDIGQAVKIGTTTGFQYIDEVQNSAQFYYWVRSVNAWDDSIVSPFNAVGGTPGETSPNASYMLDLLLGKITSSHLHASLGSRIDLIDADDSVAGSVGARIKEVRTTLEQADQLLAEQMMTLTAGTGEQFDTFEVWHFDTGTNGWGGNGTPIAAGGWIRPADHGFDAYLASPLNVDVPAATYAQIKMRIRRVGAPTWEGLVWWRHAPATWDIEDRVSFSEPSFDANDIAVVTIDMPWAGTVNSIRVDLSSASSATDHYEIDWIAIGRPAPGASLAALQRESSTRAQADAALAQDILTVQAGVDGNTVAIQQEAMARAEETGKLFARYTVKIDANGYVTGYGLALDENDGAPSSSFQVRADRFSIASPSGPGIEPVVPFAVQTTPTTIDGIVFQPGVYMTAAVMKKAIVENFVAGLAVIDDANIKNVRAGKILADSLGVGQYIQSQNFSSGSTGWRINANGNAEFQNATMRGTVYANAGAIAGIQIFSTFLRSSNYIAGVRGFQINTDGTAELNDATVRGHITADSVAANASIVSPNITGGKIVAGRVMGGNFTGYGWPSSGGGFYLGPEGLLMGRWTSGQQSQYFQVEANGNIYTPGFRVINGQMIVDQANIIDTLHVRGNAITVPAAAKFTAGSDGWGAYIVLNGLEGGKPVLIWASCGMTDLGAPGVWNGGAIEVHYHYLGSYRLHDSAPRGVNPGQGGDNINFNAFALPANIFTVWYPPFNGNWELRVRVSSSPFSSTPTYISAMQGKR